jgi:uncharacterized membrane protein
MGLQNAVANIAGILAGILTGQLVDVRHHYTEALWLAGGIALFGIVGWLLLVPAVRPVRWARQ